MRVIDFFDRSAGLAAERICFVDEPRRFTYAEVGALSRRIAAGLAAAGVGKGARIAVHSPNSALAFIAVLGTFRAGAVWLPVHARNPLVEKAEFLRSNRCEVLFFHSSFAAEAEALKERLPDLKLAVCLDRPAAGCAALETWAGHYPAAPVDRPQRPDDVVIIKGTGGTTGRPKSVQISHRNIETMVANFLAIWHYQTPPVYLIAVPMTHGAGNIALAIMACGGTSVFLDRAEPGRIIQAISRHRVTTLFLPPTVIYMLLVHPDLRQGDYSSLRHFIYSAAPMSPDKLQEALAVFGPVMTQAYGQTEAPLLCTWLSPEEHLVEDPELLKRRLLSCGRPTPFSLVEIMDEEGRLLGPNVTGEIVVRSNLVMEGYLDNPEENEKVSRFGWHHTGDVGYKDADGYLYIVDRKKDMIISGGFNIFSSEVEQALLAHPAIQDCAVIGVPDEKWGEAVKAVIELKPDQQIGESELLDHCRRLMGSMKTPKSIEIWPELPRSAVGKVLKREIRNRYWNGRSRHV